MDSHRGSMTSSQADSEDDFTCALCVNLLYDPVSTPCGHHFCRSCLAEAGADDCVYLFDLLLILCSFVQDGMSDVQSAVFFVF